MSTQTPHRAADDAAGLARPAGDDLSTPTDWRARLRASAWGTPLVLLLTVVLVMGGAYLVKGPGKAEQAAADPGTNKISSVELKGAQSGPAPEVGKPAPDFVGTTYDGKQVSLAALKGHPVWLNFGASWCSACRAEFPDVQAASEKYKAAGLAVVGISLSEDAPAVKSYAERIGITYPQVPDPDTKIASSYRVMGVPAHVFIDKDGVVRSIDMGILSTDQLAERLGKIGA